MAKKKQERDEVEVLERREPFTATAANRARASKLRGIARAGGSLSPEDAAWLADYDEARGVTADERQAFGASKARKVSYVEEEQEAVGTGGAAAEMAAAGAMVREEGRRYDSLISVGITALRYANDLQTKMVEQLLERNRNLEEAHVQMMQAAGKQHIRSIEAEAELVRLRTMMEDPEKKDEIAQLAEQFMPFIMAKLGGAGGSSGG
jgi:hypothetical protein